LKEAIKTKLPVRVKCDAPDSVEEYR